MSTPGSTVPPALASVRELSRRTVLCWLATVDAAGHPSVSPKEVFLVGDDAVYLAHIASPGSAENIRRHGTACVALLDPFVQKGWKVTGPAAVLTEETPATAAVWQGLRKLAGPRFKFRSVLRVAPAEIREILAPSYRFFPDTTEAAQVESALKTYAVTPALDRDGRWPRDVR